MIVAPQRGQVGPAAFIGASAYDRDGASSYPTGYAVASGRLRNVDERDVRGSHGGQAIGRDLDAPGMPIVELYRRLAG